LVTLHTPGADRYRSYLLGGCYFRNSRYRPQTDLGGNIPPAARFECSTYALEGLKNLDKQCLTMVYSALVLGVSFDSRELGLDGVWCGDLGVRRRLSGKPTVSAIRLI